MHRAARAASGVTASPRSPSTSMSAAAPMRSSTAGRSVPSGHRSPAAMTAISAPSLDAAAASQLAAAVRLRKQATTTRIGVSEPVAAAAIAEPFGDARTTSGTIGALIMRLGARLQGDSGVPARTSPASGIPRSLAICRARSGAAGTIEMPLVVATLTVVEKESTSTMATSEQPSRLMRSSAPAGPQPK